VELDAKSETKHAHILFNWSGIPKNPLNKKENYGISFARKFTNENGNTIDPAVIKQGDVFNMTITVYRNIDEDIDNIALTQILPSGWEVENNRLKNGNNSQNSDVFTDIRDDKVMWFFSLRRYQDKKTFKIKLRAITAGAFYMPATKAEAMYNHKFYAINPGFEVKVIK